MKSISILTLGLLGALSIQPMAHAATVGSCEPNAVKYVFDKTKRQTTSDTLSNLSNSAVNFTTAAEGCVIVTFSAVLGGVSSDYTFKPVLDGDPETGSFPALVTNNFPATRSVSAGSFFTM